MIDMQANDVLINKRNTSRVFLTMHTRRLMMSGKKLPEYWTGTGEYFHPG